MILLQSLSKEHLSRLRAVSGLRLKGRTIIGFSEYLHLIEKNRENFMCTMGSILFTVQIDNIWYRYYDMIGVKNISLLSTVIVIQSMLSRAQERGKGDGDITRYTSQPGDHGP